uniref:Glycosyltransferase family 2 protein n=1 Tax=Gongylonema pulchrum TaxID=637853 RepID=A0A183EZ83_9BILA
LGRLEHPSVVDLSDFYRDFLNERYNSLIAYNRQWYYRNIALFWPAFKVQLIRFRRTLGRFIR